MKHVISVVGARPNFMKVAPLHRAFEPYASHVRHSIVHTGQHYDATMSDAFFRDLSMPEPAYFLGAGSGSHAEQTATILVAFERICLEERPDMVVVVGDVNSTLAATITATKCGIPVAHVEAGLRSFDRTMPEELNRLATDALCDYAFITEERALHHLLHEGWAAQGRRERIFFVGNTMIDSLHFALPQAQRSTVLTQLDPEVAVEPRSYVLATLHRPSNVDNPEQLQMLVDVLLEIPHRYGKHLVFPVHPRTRAHLERSGLMQRLTETTRSTHRVYVLQPQGYIDFLALMMNADAVLTDSGGVQEETTVLGVPCLTFRTSTERPVTCEVGTNLLVVPEQAPMRQALHNLLTKPRKKAAVPPLWDGHAAERIAQIVVEQCLG